MQKIQPFALGIALGGVWSACAFILGLTAMFGWGGGFVAPISSLYIGYSASVVGAVIGGVWAFFDGFIGGLLVAWVYNAVAKT